MTVSALCYDLVRPALPSGSMMTRAPRILYGAGTPAGTIEPWKSAEKGSIFLSTDQTAGATAMWVKCAANDAVADWASSGQVRTLTTRPFNLDAGNGTVEDDVFYFVNGATLLTASLIYTEATDASGAADANIKIGSAAAGAQHVAAVAIGASKAIGDVTALTLVTGVVAAGGTVYVRNTGITATEAGAYKVQLTYVEP